MFNRFLLTAAIALGLACVSAPAYADIEKTNVDTFTVGFGGFNIIPQGDPKVNSQSAFDYRLEYRSGYSLLANLTEPYVAIRPFVGFEGTSDKAGYGLAGFLFDIPIGRHFFLTESEGVGLFDSGHGEDMGSVIEFRSQLEGGYKFDDQSRVSVAINHISNAGLTQRNHGEESVVGYYSIPIAWICGQDTAPAESAAPGAR